MALRYLETTVDLPPSVVLVKANLGGQLGPSHVHPGPAETVTNCVSFCSSKQVAQSQSQALSDIGLHQNPSQEAQNQHTQWPASENIRAIPN